MTSAPTIYFNDDFVDAIDTTPPDVTIDMAPSTRYLPSLGVPFEYQTPLPVATPIVTPL